MKLKDSFREDRVKAPTEVDVLPEVSDEKKVRRLKALFIVLCLALPSLTALAKPIDVVFDLDWTLLYTTNAKAAEMDPRGVFEVEGKLYRLADGAIEILRSLHDNPNYRVSFLSGGTASRNAEALKIVYGLVNSDGRKRSPYRVGHIDDLIRTEAPETARFTDKFKKRLRGFIPDFDPSRAVLVDDSKGFYAAEEEENFFWLQRTFDDIPDFSRRSELPVDPKYYPSSEDVWRSERAKLLWAFEAIERSREISERTDDASGFLKALKGMQADRDSALGRDLIAGAHRRLGTTLKSVRLSCGEVVGRFLAPFQPGW